MSKQDRQGVRTPADIERKYDLGGMASNLGSQVSADDLNRLNQTLAQYTARTNALISELQAKNEALEHKVSALSPCIVIDAEGEDIEIYDASDNKLKGLILYGKTVQSGTPSVENPIPLVSTGEADGCVSVEILNHNEGTVCKTSFDVSSGLAGIPVSASTSANYSDANNQRMVCDEMDFERGVYVQRIGKIESYAGEDVGTDFMSSTGELSNGATVYYRLVSPIETELSAEAMSKYAEMQTFYPYTYMYGDDANVSCGIRLKYVADTKLYIDKMCGVAASVEETEA